MSSTNALVVRSILQLLADSAEQCALELAREGVRGEDVQGEDEAPRLLVR